MVQDFWRSVYMAMIKVKIVPYFYVTNVNSAKFTSVSYLYCGTSSRYHTLIVSRCIVISIQYDESLHL